MKKNFLYTYKQKLFVSLIVLATAIIGALAFFQHINEKELRTEQLQETLNSYAELAANHLEINQTRLDEIIHIFPQELRITILDTSGIVSYDNKANNLVAIENLKHEPEITQALSTGKGYSRRISSTQGKDYIYVAIKRNNQVVRTSMAYNSKLVKRFIKPNQNFLLFTVFLFFIIFFTLFFISSEFSKAINLLREFSFEKKPNGVDDFPEGELGDIAKRIVKLHTRNSIQKQRLQSEKDKLIMHFHYSDHGIAIFSSERALIYNNALFVQYSGAITPDSFEVNQILSSEAFRNIRDFLDKKEVKSFSEVITQGDRYFDVKAIVFDDLSFELGIIDNTIAEKNRRIKHDMTQNIAHELRTPVSTIRGYLETLQTVKVSPEKQQHFLERAKLQADRLAELVTDIAMITKMEETPDLYPKEDILLNDIIDQSTDSSKLKVHISLNDDLPIFGNRNLLQTIFQNLIDNANRYAGEKAEIFISCYLQDEQYYYFSVHDTGKGVDEAYLTRIFERFYRVDEGRNRNDGGTGLGLSLVKNAVLMHNGDIQAQNLKEGGLKFLFTLKKN